MSQSFEQSVKIVVQTNTTLSSVDKPYKFQKDIENWLDKASIITGKYSVINKGSELNSVPLEKG